MVQSLDQRLQEIHDEMSEYWREHWQAHFNRIDRERDKFVIKREQKLLQSEQKTLQKEQELEERKHEYLKKIDDLSKEDCILKSRLQAVHNDRARVKATNEEFVQRLKEQLNDKDKELIERQKHIDAARQQCDQRQLALDAIDIAQNHLNKKDEELIERQRHIDVAHQKLNERQTALDATASAHEQFIGLKKEVGEAQERLNKKDQELNERQRQIDAAQEKLVGRQTAFEARVQSFANGKCPYNCGFRGTN